MIMTLLIIHQTKEYNSIKFDAESESNKENLLQVTNIKEECFDDENTNDVIQSIIDSFV